MSSYEDKRREEARRRLAARRGEASGSAPDGAAGRSSSPAGRRDGRAASLSSLHRVSPQMRERYGVSGESRGRTSRYAGDWDDYDDVTWDDGRGSRTYDWNTPAVDPIGGRNLRDARNRSQGVGGILGRFGGPFVAVLALVVVLLVAVIVLAANSCASDTAGQEGQAASTALSADGSEGGSGSASGSSAASSSSSDSSAASSDEPDKEKLAAIVGEETAEKLITRAVTSDEVKWIATHPEAYAAEGDAVQKKLLKLAADEPAAYSFVRNYPDKYPMKTPEDGKVNTVTTGKGIPRFYQWDSIWGYTTYSGTAFGLTGCCPTALAMVYQGLTGNTDLSPYDMAEMAERDGYATDYEGTYANFLTEEAGSLGLAVTELSIDKESLKNALQSGQVVIANFAPGIFTEYGHYVVITGTTQDGSLVMNDPYSEERSNRTWSYDTIVNESQGLYAYG